MSIYIYGFQSFGDDGLRELDEPFDDVDANEEQRLLGFVIAGWLTRIFRWDGDDDDGCGFCSGYCSFMIGARRWYGWWCWANRRVDHICRQRCARRSRCSGTIFGSE